MLFTAFLSRVCPVERELKSTPPSGGVGPGSHVYGGSPTAHRDIRKSGPQRVAIAEVISWIVTVYA